MSQIFVETVSRAIAEYRQMLRRYFDQSERMHKLSELGLKDSTIYDSELSLYNVGQKIVADIEANLNVSDEGYYSYSGVGNFCKYLKEYLNHYEVENGRVVHRAQKASAALVKAIQLATLPDERLNSDIAKEFERCNEMVAVFGSNEQCELYRSNLERRQAQNRNFFTAILQNFESKISIYTNSLNEGDAIAV